MRRAPIAVAVAALILLVVLAMTTGSSASSRALPASSTAPVTSTTLVCPDIKGSPPGTTTRGSVSDVARAMNPPSSGSGTVTQTVLAGAKSAGSEIHPQPTTILHSKPKTGRTVEVTASGSAAATLSADQVTETPTGRFRAMSGVRCESPSTDWWFTGADGRVGFTDVLILANPAPTPAEVAITLWSDKGSVSNARLGALRLPADSTMHIPVASAAPDSASVAIHIHATSGAVTAAVLDNRSSALLSEGGDFIPATTAPSRNAVVAGFAPGRGPRYMIVTAPGSLDATVRLRVVTKTGSFAPSGINQIVVRAGHSRVIPLATALRESTGAVELTSDQPVVAEGLSVTLETGQRPDLMWLAATAPLRGSAAIANGKDPDGGQTYLYLTAPHGSAQVRVSSPTGRSTTITVPAGKSVISDVTKTVQATHGSWPFVVTALGSAPVYGVRTMYFAGAHGALITAEPLIALPAPIRLPPVREDPSVAVR